MGCETLPPGRKSDNVLSVCVAPSAALRFASMESSSLFAPWRMDYIRSLSKAEQGPCFLCQAAQADTDALRRERLVLWSTDQVVVLMNRFPYTNGHLLIAPRGHVADLEQLSDVQALELQKQTTVAVQLLKRAVSAQGFNVGINLGRCAGAGVPGHLHQHVVPRWGGDINFMHVIGEVSVVPQAMSQLYEELLKQRAEL
jgi:ATP adenylyltransferase